MTALAFVPAALLPVDRPQRAVVDDPSLRALRDRVLAHLAAHAHNPRTNAESIAAELGVTKRTLVRVFEHGLSIDEHLATARLHHALQELRDPELRHLRLADIAQRVGFACPAHLANAVLKATGMTPAAFRQAAY